MFMTEQQARRRLESSRNLLSRLKRDSDLASPSVLPSPFYDDDPKIMIPNPNPNPSSRGDGSHILPPEEKETNEGETQTEETLPTIPPNPSGREESAPQEDFVSSDSEDIPAPTEADEIDKRVLNQLFPSKSRAPKGLSDETRAMIGFTSTLMTQESAALAFDVTQPLVSAHHKGLTGLADAKYPEKVRENILEEIAYLQNKTRKVAFNKLLLSLGIIDNDKIKAVKTAKEASQIAGNLARVVNATAPKEVAQSQSVNFHVFVPQQSSLDTYSTIDISEPIMPVEEQTD